MSGPEYDPGRADCQVSPALRELARGWPAYEGLTDRYTTDPEDLGEPVVLTDQPCLRCTACDEEIYPTVEGRLAHVMTSHGYRMDGRQFDNQNREVGRV